MNDSQKCLLDFIKFFDQFSREYGIEYFLAGGSLLGAIRHKGFLPWDDDVDLYMKGSEWRRVKDLLIEKLPERYQVVSRETHPDYHNSIVRICDTETSAFYRSRLADNTPHGVQIEFFILEPMPEEKGERLKFYNDFWAFYEAENPWNLLHGNNLDSRLLSYDSYVSNVAMIDKGNQEEIKCKEAELFKWTEHDTQKYHLNWATYWLEFPIQAFDKQLYVPFEDTTLPVPNGFADVLYGEYGDSWTEIPPVENQAFHYNFEDYTIPYQVIEKEIVQQINKPATKKAWKERKERYVEKALLNESIKRARIEMEDKIIFSRLNSEENKCKCKKAFDDEDYNTVLKIMNEYITKQWPAFGNNYIYTLDSELLYEVVYSSFMEGELVFVDRIRKNMLEVPEFRIQQLFDDLEELRKVRFSYYYDTMKDYRDFFVRLQGKYPKQLHVQMLGIQYEIIDGKKTPVEILDDIQRIKDLHGNTHRLRKLEADMLVKAGKIDVGNALYRELLETSNDGMVNLEIKEILNR